MHYGLLLVFLFQYTTFSVYPGIAPKDDYQEDKDSDTDVKDETQEIEYKVKNQFAIEGYLQKQSLYLRKFKKRFVVLTERCLLCYENDKKRKNYRFY